MFVHGRVTPTQALGGLVAINTTCRPGWREELRVKCLAQQQNIMTLTRDPLLESYRNILDPQSHFNESVFKDREVYIYMIVVGQNEIQVKMILT